MTRAEYEAKYGAPPTAPTPVKMTRAQYEATYGTKPTTTPQQKTFISGLKEDFNRRNEIVKDAKAKSTAGKQSKVSGIFQTMGQAAGLIADVGLEAGAAVDRTVTGGRVGEMLTKGMTKIAETAPVQKAIAGYGAFKEAHPEAAANVEAAANISSVVPATAGAQMAVKGATKVAKATAEKTIDLTTKTAAKAATASKGGVSKAASAFTGVPEDVLQRAASPERAHMTERAIAHISENEKQPYLDVARRTANAINAEDEKAAAMLGAAKENFRKQFPDVVFDMRPEVPAIAKALDKFRSSGLIVENLKDGGVRISKTAQSPFSTSEVGKINNLFAKMMASGSVNVDDLLALRQSLSSAYNDVPLDLNKKPTPYHAVIMSLKEVAEPAIEKQLPTELQQAFKQYSLLQDMKEEIGNKIINGDGTLKDTAEQYLANLVNANKGNVRMNAERFKKITGLDLESEVQAVKDAQKLVPLFPVTASRTQDVIRSIAVAGLGTFAGGPLGSGVALAATSPRVAGKAAIKLGKYLAKKEGQSPASALPPKNTTAKPTNMSAPKKASMPGTVPQKAKPVTEQPISDWMQKNSALPDTIPEGEAFPALLKNKGLQTTIDKHILNAQVQIDTIGRQAMRRKESMPGVLETAKANIAKSLREADMPTFADLVEKFDVKPFTSLQEFKEALMNYLRNAQPGLSMKNVGRVHPTDRQVMVDFIDAVRTGKVGGGTLTPAQRLAFETEARRAAPGYGINPDLAPGKLADKLDQLLSRSAEKKGKSLSTYLKR